MHPPNCTDTIARPRILSFRVWQMATAVARGAVRDRMGRMVAILRVWRRRACERRYLAAMDERLLKDIGVTSTDAAHEANRRFWQAPVLDETTRGRRRRS